MTSPSPEARSTTAAGAPQQRHPLASPLHSGRWKAPASLPLFALSLLLEGTVPRAMSGGHGQRLMLRAGSAWRL